MPFPTNLIFFSVYTTCRLKFLSSVLIESQNRVSDLFRIRLSKPFPGLSVVFGGFSVLVYRSGKRNIVIRYAHSVYLVNLNIPKPYVPTNHRNIRYRCNIRSDRVLNRKRRREKATMNTREGCFVNLIKARKAGPGLGRVTVEGKQCFKYVQFVA